MIDLDLKGNGTQLAELATLAFNRKFPNIARTTQADQLIIGAFNQQFEDETPLPISRSTENVFRQTVAARLGYLIVEHQELSVGRNVENLDLAEQIIIQLEKFIERVEQTKLSPQDSLSELIENSDKLPLMVAVCECFDSAIGTLDLGKRFSLVTTAQLKIIGLEFNALGIDVKKIQALHFKDSDKDNRAAQAFQSFPRLTLVSDELGVKTMLEGSVQSSGYEELQNPNVPAAQLYQELTTLIKHYWHNRLAVSDPTQTLGGEFQFQRKVAGFKDLTKHRNLVSTVEEMNRNFDTTRESVQFPRKTEARQALVDANALVVHLLVGSKRPSWIVT